MCRNDDYLVLVICKCKHQMIYYGTTDDLRLVGIVVTLS